MLFRSGRAIGPEVGDGREAGRIGVDPVLGLVREMIALVVALAACAGGEREGLPQGMQALGERLRSAGGVCVV